MNKLFEIINVEWADGQRPTRFTGKRNSDGTPEIVWEDKVSARCVVQVREDKLERCKSEDDTAKVVIAALENARGCSVKSFAKINFLFEI